MAVFSPGSEGAGSFATADRRATDSGPFPTGSRAAASSSRVERAWDSLLRLRDAVGLSSGPVRSAFLRLDSGPDPDAVSLDGPFGSLPRGGPVAAVLLDPELPIPPASRADAVFLLDRLIRVRTIRSGGLPRPVLRLFKTYLPYAFSAMRGRALGRAFAVSHFAQSLDGRIATWTGDSRPIGSPANFVHAHRMRALSDGVIIGGRTLRRDRPRLTVRHVAGAQPARIVLSSSGEDLDALTGVEGGDVFLVGGNGRPAPPSVRLLALGEGREFIPTSLILRALFERGIRSVYIEGGALTTSRFLGEGNLDVLQVHISPFILGSGLSAFRLPPVRRISSSLRLADHVFTPVDDGMMIVGTVASPAGERARP